MMGIFSKRVNNTGAVAGMLVGLLVTLVYIFLHKGWFFIPTPTALPTPIRCSARSSRPPSGRSAPC